MNDLTSFEELIGIRFTSRELLRQALVHSSYCNENPGTVNGSNERLEFLGDAILGFIIAEKLYEDCPGSSEGELTRLRSILVRREMLASKALTIRLNEFLYLGKGEESSGGRLKPMNLAGALESVIAAVYLDQGISPVKEFVLRLLEHDIVELREHGEEIDYKSRLQEIVQGRYQLKPIYTVVEASGPDHDRTFRIEVKAGNKVLGEGIGKSKKAAETEAARSALEHLNPLI